ncbi:MAG: PorT family protein [Prevotellaceae bacterium]|jgi:hypothetical protein|nr:PorT family protein [Prevotellaceae bacterium]
MKKRIWLMIFMSVGLWSQAQTADWKFGVNFASGLSWSNASMDVAPDGAGGMFDISIVAEKYFRERYAFYAGLSYMNSKAQIKNNSAGNISLKTENLAFDVQKSANYRLQYLTVPVGMKFVTQQFRLFSYYFQAGLLPGVKIGGSVALDDGVRHSFSKDLNLMTCGVQLSSGCLYPIMSENFVKGGLIFNYFFTDALNASNMKAFPLSAGIVLGYVF